VEKQKLTYTMYRDAAKEVELELEEKNSELLEKQDYEINIATLNERNRIAMEIHDNVGHLLTSAILQTGAISSINKDKTLDSNIDVLNKTLSSAMDSIRESVHDIHEQSLNMEAQIRDIISNFKFCPVELDYMVNVVPHTNAVYAIITTIKEALSNIVKHSNATSVQIFLREHPSLYQLIIKDNGTIAKLDKTANGIGLKNMETRILKLNGNINIDTTNGFSIFISLPK
jgi:signal transduction histidine kinase